MKSSLIRKGTQLFAHMYADTGSGFVNATSFSIPTTRPGKIKHIIKLPPNAKALYWSPMQSKGSLLQAPIQLRKLTHIERLIRMFEWVLSDIAKFRKTEQARQYGITVKRLFFDLRRVYDDCAKLRIHSVPPTYATLIDDFESLGPRDREAINYHLANMASLPLISIVMPVYNPNPKHLREAIESVRNQIYPNWELCAADDCSPNPEIRRILTGYQELDRRIKVVFREENGHISEASNSAIEIATGEFIALLDHDDILPSHALYYVATEIDNHSEVNVIYSDEDKIDAIGNRSDPYFKSDWNPDLFLSHNMISHLGVYRTSLVRKVGGFRSGYEGSQDYDLALRCIKLSETSQIRHVPHVLYHWRIHDESTAGDPHAKSYAYDAAVRALRDFFGNNPSIRIEHGKFIGTYRVHYPLPLDLPKVSLLIPSRDAYAKLRKCIESIKYKTAYPNWEIIIINNRTQEKSARAYLKIVSRDPRIRVVDYDSDFNYSAINNFGERFATGEIIGLLNNDVEVINKEWLSEMVSHVLRPEIGVVGAKLLYSDGFVQHAGVVIGIGGFAAHAHRLFPGDHPGYAGRAVLTQNFSAVTAACMLVRRDVFRKLNGLNETELPVSFNDIDFCLRAGEAGYRILWTPHAQLYHYESYSRGDDQASASKRARFNREKNFMIKRWRTNTTNDKYYNPNLTVDKEDFSLAHRPRLTRPWEQYLDLSTGLK
ncbi:glycosyltransferase [Paraburkholderia sp. RP-4-7]|uniref:Glycosyltransferase n=1 Tax=Paraburkholderia polaris TaxID=2728848 RepID=A0A848IP33_9BURK|nr:glycosyltransferase [Paraburkholderia polaris]